MSVNSPPSPHPLFLTDNIKMDRIPTKIRWKVHVPFILYFQVFNIHLIKTCKIEPPVILLFVVFISFYIGRYHFFCKFLELRWILSVKNIFVTIFLSSTDSLTSPPPPPPPPLLFLNGQNPLSMTKFFCQWSLNKTVKFWHCYRTLLQNPLQ